MQTKLQQHFPMIQDREAILLKIRENRTMDEEFQSWTEEQREEFLDFCTGVRGIKFLYDGFFKEIFDPDATPERLEAFLSLFLGTRVKILEVLPLDGSRIADESSLLTMDMVVQLEDGGIVNLEIQKIGYLFPGERSACYSADLLLRQYKRVRSSRRKNFSYKDIKGVYTLVLFEKSPRIFHRFPNDYLHYFEQKSNTDLELDLLQKYLFIPLDIFRKSLDNRSKFPQNTSKIKAEQDAWLTFLSVDDPEKILELIKEFPQFKPMYETAYQQCCNVEEVMRMFSEELLELDRNTTQLMIDEMQEEIEQKRAELGEKKEELEEKKTELEAKKVELSKKKEELEEKKQQLSERKAELGEKTQQLNEKKAELEAKKVELGERNQQLNEKKAELEAKKAELGEKTQQLNEKKAELEVITQRLEDQKTEIEEKTQQLEDQKTRWAEKEKASVRRLYDKLQSVAEVAEILGMEIEQVKVCLGL